MSKQYDYHIPVLLYETINLLITDIDGTYVDCTAGGGGHTTEILKRLSSRGKVFALDCDTTAINYLKKKFKDEKRITISHQNFSDIETLVKLLQKYEVTGFLLDFGLSSKMIDEYPGRGFSFRSVKDRLDMRMDNRNNLSAYEIVNNYDFYNLKRIIRNYGEQPGANKISQAILDSRPLETVEDLINAINRVVNTRELNKTLRRCFQAFRIETNDELNVIKKTLPALSDILKINGRLVCMSYHSLEDRIVKEFIANNDKECLCPPRQPVCTCGGHNAKVRIVPPRCLKASEVENQTNPRAHSVRVRTIEKIR